MGCLKLTYQTNFGLKKIKGSATLTSDVLPSKVLTFAKSEKSTCSVYFYGFNGMEADDEIKNSEGASYDFGARMFDPRVGRWLSVDPYAGTQPNQSPYKGMYNNPLIFVDPDGGTEYEINVTIHEKTGKAVVTMKEISSDIAYGKMREVKRTMSDDYYKEYLYYDFAKIKITVIPVEGEAKTSSFTQILYSDEIKDVDWIGEPSKIGETKPDMSLSIIFGDDPQGGVERSFGINMGGSTGGAGVIAKDYSRNAIGDISFDQLNTIFGRSDITKGYSPGQGSWDNMPNAKAKDWAEWAKGTAEKGSEIGEGINEVIEMNTDTTITINQWEKRPNVTTNHPKDTTVKKKDVENINQYRKYQK